MNERENQMKDGYYRLTTGEGEMFYVNMVNGIVAFRGRSLTLTLEECLVDGCTFEEVTAGFKA